MAGAVHPRVDHRARAWRACPGPSRCSRPRPRRRRRRGSRRRSGARRACRRRATRGRRSPGRPSAASSPPRRSRARRSRPAAPTPCAARCWLSRQSVAWPTTATLSAAGTTSAPAQSSAPARGRRAQRERCERCDGGESAAGHAPCIGRTVGLPRSTACSWTYGGRVSAASGRRCGPSARRRARAPRPPCSAVSARIGSGSGTAPGAPASQSSTIAGVTSGWNCSPTLAPDGERLQARGGPRQLRRPPAGGRRRPRAR